MIIFKWPYLPFSSKSYSLFWDPFSKCLWGLTQHNCQTKCIVHVPFILTTILLKIQVNISHNYIWILKMNSVSHYNILLWNLLWKGSEYTDLHGYKKHMKDLQESFSSYLMLQLVSGCRCRCLKFYNELHILLKGLQLKTDKNLGCVQQDTRCKIE